MTAVASPPSLHPLPRWTSGDAAEASDHMSAEEVSQILMPHKSMQRQNSSSSSSLASSNSNTSNPSPLLLPSGTGPQTNGESHVVNGEQGGHVPRKKAARGLWPSSKADPVSGLSIAKTQTLPTPSSGQSAASSINSAMNQGSQVNSSQGRSQSTQATQNGGRSEMNMSAEQHTALLALLPLTGTFERKQITVPYFPDTLRIGRQTNAKTIPTAVNGYFDSKVLSRQHAEVWADRNGKIWIRDVKSSNGTFVNGVRLSPENRDSEPHELREQDTLELGIDIVSEDQKSIVHHKVSAKVELAGMYNSAPTILDMMHVDPNTGQQYTSEQLGQPLTQMRGRAHQNSVGSNGRLTGPPNLAPSNANMLGGQRQMNMWMAPITVEQVVRKLTTELKQAKEQSQDLHRTTDFLGTLLTLEPGQEIPKSPHKQSQQGQAATIATGIQRNIVSPEAISPFSQPPAPPPQQPLPEKPDIARSPLSDPSIKRPEAERLISIPIPTETPEASNSQILSLVEALKAVTQESDLQGDRIKYLEMALKRERRAREVAEKRAMTLSGGRHIQLDYNERGIEEGQDESELPLDSIELIRNELPNGHVKEEQETSTLKSSSSMETIREPEDTRPQVQGLDASTSKLQARLDLMVKEMNDMKILMESYKGRAEDAEEGRRSLAEMVENIRAGRDPQKAEAGVSGGNLNSNGKNGMLGPSGMKEAFASQGDSYGSWNPLKQRGLLNGSASPEHTPQQKLEEAFSSVLQQQRSANWEGGRISQTAPYASMIGVVIIGVGIMTWLNGWQPGNER